MEFNYIDIEKIAKIINVIVGNKKNNSQLVMNIDNNKVKFIVITKNFKLAKEIRFNKQIDKEMCIEINAKQFTKTMEKFIGNKQSYATIVNFDIADDKLIIYGNKHSDEIDIEEMGYRVTESLRFELDYNTVEFNEELDIPCRIHGSDEWNTEEFVRVVNLGAFNSGNLYISGTKHTAFKAENNSITEIPIDQYIGQNTVISKSITDKLKKILSMDGSEKYYINSTKNKINIQNWDKTFKIEVKHCKAVMEELTMYNNYTGIDYDIININLIKHRVIDSIKQLMLSNGTEIVEIRLTKTEDGEYKLAINDENIDIYSAVVSNDIDDTEIRVYADIKTIYKMIKQCDSDFIALDITYLGDEPVDGIALRVSELDLEKYEDAYEEAFSNISHFELRSWLNSIEHLEMRDKCLNRKCYTVF